MRDIDAQRKLLEQANLLVKTNDEATTLGLGLSEGLGANAGPTHAEECAFWACIVIAQVWGASDLQGWVRWAIVLPWMAMAVAIRWPYWRRAWRNARKSA